MQSIPPEFRKAYQEYDREITIRKTRLGCYFGIVLVPLFTPLDYYKFRGADEGHDYFFLFLLLRLGCSVLIAAMYPLIGSSFGRRYYRFQGILFLLIPTATIAWMVGLDGGAASTYYAGLNLVLMVLAVVLDWTFWQSVASVSLVLLLYLAACLAACLHSKSPLNQALFVNNLFFLVSMGTAIAFGAYFHSKVRVREFISLRQLDKSRDELAATNQKLIELDQVKNRFFANISHELRTPLTLLLAPLEALLPRYHLDQETKDLLFTMHSNGMRLLKLINDLLDLVRLESGRMEVKREPVEVAGFAKGLASAARQVAKDKRLQLETYVDPALGTVLGDRDKLEKVVLNLLFNALKFTPAGGRVELRAEKRGQELALVVADTGMGISEKNMAHVFDRFWQADASSTRKYQGAGIGLALVKELVEVQGGQVAVESREGKGTTFTVTLPYQESDQAQPPKPEAAPGGAVAAGDTSGAAASEEWLANLYRRAELFPALAPSRDSLGAEETTGNSRLPTILVADDEPDMRHFLKSQLSARYQVLEAMDGQQAIEKASQFLPDVILLDMMMPEKDGLQACREIREHTPTQSIPIVLLTARADEETKLATLSAGASDFLTKPFSTTELHVRIKNLVESHQYQRKVSKQNQVLESTIEQLKDTEAQLVQTEKLASLGRMSAGIIHEINNPLNYAITGLFTLRNKGKYLAPDQQEGYHEILKDVEEGIGRVRTIVSDLRMFTHPDTESRDQVEVHEVVTAALRFLSNEWKDKVRIEQRLAKHQSVWANKSKLIHVLVNLLQNSLDALKAKTFADGQPTIWIEGHLESGKSILVVRDNGEGIESEHLDKIFDPFYTTKDVGEGMGLGLSICYRIVRECEGKISVRTEPGKFCEFALEFPTKGQQQK